MDMKKYTISYCMKKLLFRMQRIRINQLMRASQAHRQEDSVKGAGEHNWTIQHKNRISKSRVNGIANRISKAEKWKPRNHS